MDFSIFRSGTKGSGTGRHIPDGSANGWVDPSFGWYGGADTGGVILPQLPNDTGPAPSDQGVGATSAALASIGDSMVAPSAGGSGFVINVTYDSTVNSAPAAFKTGVAAAVAYLESQFSTSVTVNIDVGYGEVNGTNLGAGALGESESRLIGTTYSQFASALTASAKTPDAIAAAATLPTSSPAPGGDTNVAMTTAEAKALGLMGASSAVDGYVGFSATYPFAYDPNNRAVTGEYDFVGTVEHEMTEVMGRIAGLGNTYGTSTSYYTPLDFFRYSAPGTRNFVGTQSGYFSPNNGSTDLNNFNTNSGGDFGDWASSAGNDSFLAFSNSGVENAVSAADLEEMDVLGYGQLQTQPTLSGVASSVSFTQHAAASTLSGALTVADSSAATLTSATVQVVAGTFSGDGDLLTANVTGTAITSSYNASTETLTLSGTDTLADYQAVLRTVAFSSTGLHPTDLGADKTRTIDWQLNSGASSNNLSTVSQESVSIVALDVHSDEFYGNGTSDMLMRNTAGTFELYEFSNGQVASATDLGNVGTEWSVSGTGDFYGNGTSDMLMRNTTGTFELYQFSNGQVASATDLGNVGTEWSVAGIGDFYGNGTSDMLMRNTAGTFELYKFSNGQVASATNLGNVGTDWSVAGMGDFNGDGTTDMLMRNTAGTFELYQFSNGQVASATDLGNVGTDWSVAGMGDFNGDGTSDMLMRNTAGTFELYEFKNGQVASATNLGNVGTDWSVASIGDFNGDGTDDMLMRNTAGTFELYEFSNGQVASATNLGNVGPAWQVTPDNSSIVATGSAQSGSGTALGMSTSAPLDTSSSIGSSPATTGLSVLLGDPAGSSSSSADAILLASQSSNQNGVTI